MADIINLADRREWQERQRRMYTRARVRNYQDPTFSDTCIGKEGSVILVMQLKDGRHKGKFLYTLRFETPRGFINQGYFEEELDFL